MFVMAKTKKKKTKKQIKQTKSLRSDKSKLVVEDKKKKKLVNRKKKPAGQAKSGYVKKTNGDGKFKKGVSGNPSGGPRRGHAKFDILLEAISRYELGVKSNLRNPTNHFIKQAFRSDNVLISLMKKLYPDLKSIEQITFAGDSMEDEEAKQIRKEMLERFGS